MPCTVSPLKRCLVQCAPRFVSAGFFNIAACSLPTANKPVHTCFNANQSKDRPLFLSLPTAGTGISSHNVGNPLPKLGETTFSAVSADFISIKRKENAL